MAVSMILFALALVGIALILVYIYDLVFTHEEKFHFSFLLLLLALMFLSVRNAIIYIAEAREFTPPTIITDGLDILSMLFIIFGFSKHFFDKWGRGGK